MIGVTKTSKFDTMMLVTFAIKTRKKSSAMSNTVSHAHFYGIIMRLPIEVTNVSIAHYEDHHLFMYIHMQ